MTSLEPTLLSAVRDATRAAHQELDERLSPPGPWTMDRYVCFLQMSLAVVGELEGAIALHLPQFRPQHGSRRAALHADLRALGSATTAHPPRELPVISSEAAAFGAGYVLQGSMLGGAVIRRAIERDLGRVSPPVTYLNYHGEELGRTWKQFTIDLDDFGRRSDAAAWSQTVRSSQQTFAAFAAALTELACANQLT